MDKPDDSLSYLFESIERIKGAVSEAKRSWRPEAERAKLLADATHDAADTLEQMSEDDDLWKRLATQRELPIGHFSLPLTPELLTGLGYNEDEAERLVVEGNRMLKRLTNGPADDRAAARRSVDHTRKTLAELALATRRLAEEADDGIKNLEHRQGQIRRLLGLLDQVLNILMNIAVSVAVSAMFVTDPPSWVTPVMGWVADLRDGLGDGTLCLLTFAAAEQGARIVTAFAQPTAASLGTLQSWVEPSWRPLAATADPRLVQELEQLFPDLRQPREEHGFEGREQDVQLNEDLPFQDDPLPHGRTKVRSPKPDGRSMNEYPANSPADQSRSSRDDTTRGRGGSLMG